MPTPDPIEEAKAADLARYLLQLTEGNYQTAEQLAALVVTFNKLAKRTLWIAALLLAALFCNLLGQICFLIALSIR